MRIYIIGVDGYLGWPLAMSLAGRGHRVGGCDLHLRRRWVAEMGSQSATPIRSMPVRLKAFRERFGRPVEFAKGDIRDYTFVLSCLRAFRPDAIVHLGEMPSASYSMMDLAHCAFTMTNNLLGTLNILHAMKAACPEAHLVKLGTMGEYGTPNLDIPEGFFTIAYRGRTDTLPFPRQAGSWYHQTKVHDSNNVMFACRMWGLRSTDIMQGVVFGTRIDEMGEDERLLTRVDFDQCFGTAVNRYCAQAAIGHPLTPFGRGHQKRGFLPLRDSMQCLRLAIEHPPAPGEYRVFNQFEEVYDITELAQKVQRVGARLGLQVQIRPLENPRKEKEDHYYQPDHQHLLDLGYQPTHDTEAEMAIMLADLMKSRARIEACRAALIPDIRWDGSRRKVAFVSEGAPAPRPLQVNGPRRAVGRRRELAAKSA
ncbi:MAG: NAD-dependent epimerase/dehydratase family protein [Candidatus Omnitrophica bacterium]|nr:NAD-dependent epimerase/dehydratase family protein [Candidatus Omnitrophota bacterium]